jgi:NAD(P)-dependent dehydrogenase (short-subunit alcohol dehydrogenase family)
LTGRLGKAVADVTHCDPLHAAACCRETAAGSGATALFVRTDVSDEGEVSALAEAVRSRRAPG